MSLKIHETIRARLMQLASRIESRMLIAVALYTSVCEWCLKALGEKNRGPRIG